MFGLIRNQDLNEGLAYFFDETFRREVLEVEINHVVKRTKVTRSILKAKSGYFSNQDEFNLNGNKPIEPFKLLDCPFSHETMSHVISNFYGVPIKNKLTQDNVMEILNAADFFDINSIKVVCKDFLLMSLKSMTLDSMLVLVNTNRESIISLLGSHVLTFLLDHLNESHYFNIDKSLARPVVKNRKTIIATFKTYGKLLKSYVVTEKMKYTTTDQFLAFLCRYCTELEFLDLRWCKGYTSHGISTISNKLEKLKNLALNGSLYTSSNFEILNKVSTLEGLTFTL